MATTKYLKDPDAVLDYVWDWDEWLAEGETITEATVVGTGVTIADAPPVAIAGGGTRVTAWVSGGTVNKAASARCRITTSARRIDDRTITFEIKQR